jgi:thymidylate synthase
MIVELLWFLRGDTSILFLHQNNVKKFWHEDTYKRYVKEFYKNSKNAGSYPLEYDAWLLKLDDTRAMMLASNKYMHEAGPIYGKQWRDNDGVDQLKNLIDTCIIRPYSRYQVVTAWNVKDIPAMALPPCHVYWQTNMRPLSINERYAIASPAVQLAGDAVDTDEECMTIYDKAGVPKFALDLAIVQRSCDMPLGVPINIASYSLLIHILSNIVGAVPGELIWYGMSCHIYENQVDLMENVQLKNESYYLPTLEIDDSAWVKYNGKNLQEVIESIKVSDFKFHNYNCNDEIRYPLSTGLVKQTE